MCGLGDDAIEAVGQARQHRFDATEVSGQRRRIGHVDDMHRDVGRDLWLAHVDPHDVETGVSQEMRRAASPPCPTPTRRPA